MKADKMSEFRMTRNQFLCGGSGLVAASILGGVTGSECARCEEVNCPNATPAAAGNKQDDARYRGMTLRPYQALCIVCSLGEDDAGPKDEKLKQILDRIRKWPHMPVALRSNAGDVYTYQDAGTEDDTPQSAEYNTRRDLAILEKLALAPGSVLPARILFRRLLEMIPTLSGICAYDGATSGAWRGCPRAKSGFYEKGRKKGITAIVPPRSEAEMAKDKVESLKAMYQAEAIAVMPHILICAVAQYSGGVRPPYKPDNLPEFIQHILRNPETPVTMGRGPTYMICGPCPERVPDLNGCAHGVYQEMKNLNVLQRLGLTYGSTMKARELYKLIFERIPSTAGVCALPGNPSDFFVWRDPCGQQSPRCPDYQKGREELMKEFEIATAGTEKGTSLIWANWRTDNQ